MSQMRSSVYDQGYGSNIDFLTEPSYGTEPSYEVKNEHSPISYGNGNNFLSYGQPQEGKTADKK